MEGGIWGEPGPNLGLEKRGQYWQAAHEWLGYYSDEGFIFIFLSLTEASWRLGFIDTGILAPGLLSVVKNVCVYCKKIIFLFKVINHTHRISVGLPFICQIPDL